MKEPIVPIRASTQSFTEIEDIDHDLVLFGDGSVAMVIATTAVNFGLLSEKEQEAIIYAYAGLLNSLSFPIQLLIRSQHKDVTAYLNLLSQREDQQKNPKLAKSIHSYRLFVEATVKEKEVLDKNFYIVIPFSRLELGSAPKILFGGKKQGLPYSKEYIYERAQTVLPPKRDQIIRLLTRIGLRANQLSSEALMRLFFLSYNPGSPMPDLTKIIHR
ncbi:hypothetical protein HY031_02325 [Candidatus Gottesmanbacteria bacterium]|nr:hypothetical protein [Candidatus Gottesmanbacteria bacterium]MBI3576421.1 hypothetical protein [Candidatus Gottesmanbacteria bacterium]